MPLSSERLATMAVQCMQICAEPPKPLAEFYRDALHALAADPLVREKHAVAAAAIRRMLAVDMSKPQNRKGAVPQAIGLVGRDSLWPPSAKHRAILLMVDRLEEYVEQADRPYWPVSKAAHAVVEGFFESGIDKDLTPDNVEKIVSRDRRAARARVGLAVTGQVTRPVRRKRHNRS